MADLTSFLTSAAAILDTAAHLGAAYADVRVEHARSERIEVRNGDVAALAEGSSRGYGVRALVDGAWGFASGAVFNRSGYDDVAASAVANARANAAIARALAAFVPERVYVDRYKTPIRLDPSSVSLDDRARFLLDVERRLHSHDRVSVGRAWIDVWTTDKVFASTAGSRIVQRIQQLGCGMQAMAVGDGDVQVRSFPGDAGIYGTGGWELIEAAHLPDNAERIGEEAAALLSAPQCPSGVRDLVLGGSQVSLQLHESCGHPAELDRVMGWEANFSGTSFLEVAKLGELRYGSPIVNIEIDNTLAGGFSTCGYDDEGTKSVRADLVRDGILTGFEMSNDTARAIGRESNGCARAFSWAYLPMVRMCNINLLPGDAPFEDLVAGVRDGIYMESNRSWSIDDRRLNFQFGCQIGWEIKRGKRGRILKNPTYGGTTPTFWNACDAIADANSWRTWSTPNCGKGEPMQTGRTTQAAAPARFRNVEIGVGYAS